MSLELKSDRISRIIYSVDASIHEVLPTSIVFPRNEEEVLEAIAYAKKKDLSITCRGAATGITGGCLGEGLIVDLSRHFTRILEIDIENQTATVEPGVVQDTLNFVLKEKGYRLGPDTSTGDRATIGGMLMNNAAGARSLKYGCMADHILEVTLALASGETLTIGPDCSLFTSFLHRHREIIARDLPPVSRRSSGYLLDRLLTGNYPGALAGSEGTLGIVTKIKLRICKVPKKTTFCCFTFDSMQSALLHVEKLLSFHPISLELLDEIIIKTGKSAPSLRGTLSWLQGAPKAMLTAEFEGKLPLDCGLILDNTQKKELFALRKAGLGLLLSKRSYSRAIAFIEDLFIPPPHLPSFMDTFLGYLKERGKEAGIYGHAGPGCLHIRPYMDLRSPEDFSLLQTMMQDITDLVKKQGGALSGEHGDGMIRSWLNPRLFGTDLMHVFANFKALFDPDNLMNPGKIVGASTFPGSLRTSPKKLPKDVSTYFSFKKEGGFTLTADLCNGNGLCRKKKGLMCPSFQATGDEYDTTRARAQAFRSFLYSNKPESAFSSLQMKEILDLCIQCKGCKTECPSHVDMAKMKAEFLYQYHQKNRRPLRDYLFAHIASINRFTPAALFNVLSPLASLFGIAGSLPMAKKRLSKQLPQQTAQKNTVILFVDTFSEFHAPEIALAAIKVLSQLGYYVVTPPWTCCGRPLISKGFLKQAKDAAERVQKMLSPYKGYPIITLEPSCLSALTDEYEEFLDKPLKNVLSFDEFVAGHKEKLILSPSPSPLFIHGHCHTKALRGMNPTLEALSAIPDTQVHEIPSGCCGMAGSFGYEKKYQALSLQIAEATLFPYIRQAMKATIIANGISCRSQIKRGMQVHALHLAELFSSLGPSPK